MIDVSRLRVTGAVDLRERDPADDLGVADEDAARERNDELTRSLATLQYRLEGEDARAVLLLLQGLPTSGKDETLRAALRGLNPQAYRTVHFGGPPEGEAAGHDYLWRYHREMPSFGTIGLFNRSYVEAVVSERVYGRVPEDVWRRRYGHIRDFERMLRDEGTEIVRCFLHVSREEQARRLRGRIEEPERRWEFDEADLRDRDHFDAFLDAFEDAIAETATDDAPWFVIPADRPIVRDLAVLEVLHAQLEAMDPQVPDDAMDDDELAEARERLGEGPTSEAASPLDWVRG